MDTEYSMNFIHGRMHTNDLASKSQSTNFPRVRRKLVALEILMVMGMIVYRLRRDQLTSEATHTRNELHWQPV